MDEVYKRHQQYPYVYEEQVMILIDRHGNRDTRKLRRYSRIKKSGLMRNLIVFDDPPEVRGVGLLTTRFEIGGADSAIYLPAYGPKLISSVGHRESSNFLGSDFSVRDLMPEILDNFDYQRKKDERHEDNNFLIVDVFKKDNPLRLRRIYIREDIYYITRTDHFDRHGRILKRHTNHDLKSLGQHLWRANLMHMVDYHTNHKTLLKINKRVFSKDYVPEQLFTLEWLINNQHMPAVPEEMEEKTQDTGSNDLALRGTE